MYVDMYERLSDVDTRIPFSSLTLTETLLRYYGAHVTPVLDAGVTHVVIDVQHMERYRAIRQELKRLFKGEGPPYVARHLVRKEWVLECARLHEDLDERDYLVLKK